MQTFLPYADFERSAACLDRQRLGKQRVETLRILRALTLEKYGWKNHPAVKMWRGHTRSLLAYGYAICEEWTMRGYADLVTTKLVNLEEFYLPYDSAAPPDWFGDEAFHLSHQSNLIRKDPDYYRPIFGYDVPDDLPYVWPIV